MTDDMMNLQTLSANSSDADMARKMISFAAL